MRRPRLPFLSVRNKKKSKHIWLVHNETRALWHLGILMSKNIRRRRDVYLNSQSTATLCASIRIHERNMKKKIYLKSNCSVIKKKKFDARSTLTNCKTVATCARASQSAESQRPRFNSTRCRYSTQKKRSFDDGFQFK